jgi:hypothetical protein
MPVRASGSDPVALGQQIDGKGILYRIAPDARPNG